MKINKEQLMETIKRIPKTELSLSEVLELAENMPTFLGKNAKKSNKVVEKEDLSDEIFIIDDDEELSDEITLIDDSELSIPPHIQSLIDDGYIRDPGYAHVLARNKSYMTYLNENSALFLEKRIEWKINKLIGLTSYNVVAKDIYQGNTEEIVNSQSVRILEAFLLKRLHIPRERLTNTPIIDLIYLLDAYGTDTHKVLFFLIRSNDLTASWFNHLHYRCYNPRTLRDIPLDEFDDILRTIKSELALQLKKIYPVGKHIAASVIKIANLLDVDSLTSSLDIPRGAIAGDLIDPLAHIYKERRTLARDLNRLNRHEINLRTGNLSKFKPLYNATISLCSVYQVSFPYDSTMEELFEVRQPLVRAYETLFSTLEHRLEKIL